MRTSALILADLALKSGGLRTASRRSGVAVSTISSALERLERELGVGLARRTDAGLALTVEAARHAAPVARLAGLCAAIHGLPLGRVPHRSVGLEALFRFTQTLRVGSIRGAALQMQMAQPHLTRQLAQIEQALGCTLLARTSGGIAATAEGGVLAARIDLLEAEWRALTRMTEASHSALSRRYTLGTIIPADPQGELAGLIATIARELMLRRDMQLSIASSTAEELLHGLDASRYDAVLVDAQPDAAHYRREAVAGGTLALFGRHIPDLPSPAARLRHALTRQVLAVQSQRSGLRQRAEAFLDACAGPDWRSLTRIIEVDSLPVLARLVREGDVLSVLPAASAQALADVPRLTLPDRFGQTLWLTWRPRPRAERMAAQILHAIKTASQGR